MGAISSLPLMTTPDAASLAMLGAASIGLTQIVKDLGVQGEWLKFVCVGISIALGLILIYQPALWTALVVPLVGATGTGGVSLTKEIVSQWSIPSGE
jgi:hypothetical protein